MCRAFVSAGSGCSAQLCVEQQSAHATLPFSSAVQKLESQKLSVESSCFCQAFHCEAIALEARWCSGCKGVSDACTILGKLLCILNVDMAGRIFSA